MAGWTAGWLVGLLVSGTTIARFLGLFWMLVPAVCGVTFLAGVPAFALLRLVTPPGKVGDVAAFAIAVVGCTAVVVALVATVAAWLYLK